ncbi:MAG: hypothetical protein IKY22_04060 [Bacteroidales bacterium]|nr:hypothetical protein [Bacteroidales bacterium]
MNVNHNERIDYLLAKFYAVESSTAENDELFEYFLYANPLPDCYADDMPLIRAFAIMRYCKTTEAEFRQSLKAARQTAETRKRFAPKLVLRIAAAAACVAVLLIGLWQVGSNFIFVTPASEDVPPQYASVLIAQNSDEHSVTVQEKETPQIQYTIIQDELHATSRLTTEQNTATDEPTHQYASAETATTTDTATENLIDTMPQPYIETTTQSDYYLVYNETTVSDDKVVSYCSSQCSRKTMMDILTQVIVM